MNEQLQWFLLGWALLVNGCVIAGWAVRRVGHVWTLVYLFGCAHAIVGVLIILGPFVLRMVRL